MVKKLHAEKEGPLVSPYVFMQAYGTLFKNGDEALDGESQQEARHFLDLLLTRLDGEASPAYIPNPKPSLVNDLFNVDTETQVI